MIRAWVIDDEPLAVRRLIRMLEESGRVTVQGSSSDPVAAAEELIRSRPDVLFLDIQMPGLTGFELLAKLPESPLVIFTTAYDRYALEAFEVNSVDYLLKPVDPERLKRALDKVDRLLTVSGARPPFDAAVLEKLVNRLSADTARTYLRRIATRTGSRMQVLDLECVTHFYAEDKLTFAATGGKAYVIDFTIAELEQRLDPAAFLRIHRSTLVNLQFVQEVDAWFGGRAVVKLNDDRHTQHSRSPGPCKSTERNTWR